MKNLSFLLCLALILFFGINNAASQEKCVNTEAEAAIINNDIPSATLEATARAKWLAIEQVVGVKTKEQSFYQNCLLVETVMKTKAGGVVKSYKVLDQKNTSVAVNVKINACVEADRAREAVSKLGLNNSIAIFIPARKPGRRGDEFEETNILSETIISKLAEQGYTVVDVASTKALSAKMIENAVRSDDSMTVRSMMYKFLSNLIIIGKIDYSISTRKGENIGYGLSMPFNHVTVRLNYRIVAKNNNTGNMEILSTGVEQAKGLANNVQDAAAEAMKELADNFTPTILDKVGKYIQGNTKKISVKVNNVSDVNTVIKIKHLLQSIIWVSEVEETQMSNFVVSYPENTLYLANSINQKGHLKVVNFSPYSLVLDYQK